MTDKQRDFYKKRYRHLRLHFPHGRGWDELTLIAAMELDTLWPAWMPYWLKHALTWLHDHGYNRLVPFVADYPRFLQIKEKYGTLRLYGAAHLEGLLELMSCYMCEECGTRHNIGHTSGWVQTLCQGCALKVDPQLKNWVPAKENE